MAKRVYAACCYFGSAFVRWRMSSKMWEWSTIGRSPGSTSYAPTMVPVEQCPYCGTKLEAPK